MHIGILEDDATLAQHLAEVVQSAGHSSATFSTERSRSLCATSAHAAPSTAAVAPAASMRAACCLAKRQASTRSAAAGTCMSCMQQARGVHCEFCMLKRGRRKMGKPLI